MHVCNLCQGVYSIVCSPGINRAILSFMSSILLYKGGQRLFSLFLAWSEPHPFFLHSLLGGGGGCFFSLSVIGVFLSKQ